ncbi:MAG: DNA replication/repair protein RecF [Gammaproteobacteria bacterium]|nr:DNA replication/repair protein RecF [Gammaproteobacteria bacterium]
MSLTRLNVKHVRNLLDVQLHPSSGLNLIVGDNASGKTSLLEAIYLLGMGRSFRSINIKHVIQQETASLLVFGSVLTPTGNSINLGIEKQSDRTRIKVAGEWVKNSSSLVMHLPLQLITPDSHKLIEQGPRYRRQFMDWGVFHVEHRFHDTWSRFQKSLKQRNAGLKQKLPRTSLQVWEQELSSAAERIDDMRRRYISELMPIAQKRIEQLTDLQDIQLSYQQGWKQGIRYQEYLEQHDSLDREAGYTRYGPQRAEIAIRQAGMPAAERVSRGQQKLLACALRLAQVEHLKQKRGISSLVMVDDLPAELDKERRGKFLEMLRDLDIQVFVTATEEGLINNRNTWKERKMFHVEHGQVREVL